MVEPRIIPRAEHVISRRDIDGDALKVLYRLHQADHIAYLVGGGVRDLLLARRPKDFDIGTSAHPYQVKKLFRNCWIIGRRFRLAHVKFGNKVVEVATFRRQLEPGEEIAPESVSTPGATSHRRSTPRDNTFGTPEEDAFRRDFTINALIYDIATFSVIDYVKGMEDLAEGLVRCIGDPEVRFKEDPVRMIRAIALASRLDFTVDQPILDAIRKHRTEIAKASPARLLEEYYKILRAGSSEKTFKALAGVGLLDPVSPELHRGADEELWRSLAGVDEYRARFESVPDTLTNPILLGSLLAPLGLAPKPGRPAIPKGAKRAPVPRLGELPLARRDVERLRQLIGLQPRLRDLAASPRAKRGLIHRGTFREALTWLEIHGNAPDVVEQWITVLTEQGASGVVGEPARDAPPTQRRRRRRRRRSRPKQ